MLKYYTTQISLIEIKWVILKLTKKNKRALTQLKETYNETLEYLTSTDEIKQTPLITPEISRLEDKLSGRGLNDYFDRMITATAKIYADIFLTEDKELIRQIKTVKEFKDLEIINWQQFIKQKQGNFNLTNLNVRFRKNSFQLP